MHAFTYFTDGDASEAIGFARLVRTTKLKCALSADILCICFMYWCINVQVVQAYNTWLGLSWILGQLCWQCTATALSKKMCTRAVQKIPSIVISWNHGVLDGCLKSSIRDHFLMSTSMTLKSKTAECKFARASQSQKQPMSEIWKPGVKF